MKTFLSPLTPEQEMECLKKMKDGDLEAKKELTLRNMRLVAHVAKKYQNSDEDMEDLISIGTIGLIKAIDHFNTELGVRFSTYAVPMIIGEIRRFLRDNNSIRVSRSLRDTAYKAIYAREMLLKKNQKEPSITEVASEVGISREDIVYALDAIQNPMSLYEPIFTDGGDTLYVMDQIRDKKNREENWVEHLSLSDALKKLNAREHEIISLRFFGDAKCLRNRRTGNIGIQNTAVVSTARKFNRKQIGNH